MQFSSSPRISSITKKSNRRSAVNKLAESTRRSNQRLALESLESRCLLSTLYVATSGNDSGAGSSSSPFQTIQKAVNSAKAGDTVIVRAGTYNQGVNMNGLAGGTASNPITVEADPSASPGSVIVTHIANASSGANYDAAAFNVESTGSWVIEGFTINGDGSMQKAGIRDATSNNDQIIDNVVNHCFTGIFVSGATSTVIQGNTCENSTDQHGIYISLNTNGTQVIGNTLFGNNWDGLHMNCLVGSPNQNAVVEGNVSYNNGLSGMDIEGINNATFANNVIYNNTKHGITVHSQDQASTPDTMNNTFVNNTIVGNGMFGIQFQPADTQGEVLFNNIFMNSNSAYGAIGVSGTPSGLTSDYNAVVSDFSQTLGTSNETLAQWQSSTGQDKHDIVTTTGSLFVSGSNYALKSGSPAIDAGTASLGGRSAPTIDFSGNSRPQGGGYDIGAYESGSGGTDTTPPTLSAIAAGNLTSSGATVTWTTNEASTTQVQYGTTTNYGSSTSLNSSLVTSHSAALSGLNAGTTYHFRVVSTDASGNQAVSSDFTFTTAAATGDTTAPTATVSSSGPITPGSDIYTFTLTYADNKAVSGFDCEERRRDRNRAEQFQPDGFIGFLKAPVPMARRSARLTRSPNPTASGAHQTTAPTPFPSAPTSYSIPPAIHCPPDRSALLTSASPIRRR